MRTYSTSKSATNLIASGFDPRQDSAALTQDKELADHSVGGLARSDRRRIDRGAQRDHHGIDTLLADDGLGHFLGYPNRQRRLSYRLDSGKRLQQPKSKPIVGILHGCQAFELWQRIVIALQRDALDNC